MRFEGKTVVVTGAASGLGRTMVTAFADEGARVVAVDLNEGGLRELYQGRDDVTTCRADITVSADADAIIEASGAAIDVLCNNAGILDGLKWVDEVSEEDWSRVIAVNLTGAFLLTRRVVPLMVDHGGGSIVNTASVAGLRGARAGAAYTASKFGLVGLTYNVAATFGPSGVRCNAICPGGMITEMASHGLTERGAYLTRRDKHKPSPAEPEKVAAVALFLASDDAAHVNGAALPVDGGMLAY
jgi:NAD(P)-dependent dehydrogenase (short-subunit alcohol dehydrogenase family)